MLVEKNLKEALEYYIKGKPVTALWIGEDGSMKAMPLSDILNQPENHFLVDVPAVVNPDFEQAVQEIGFGSYCLENVIRWKEQCFELVERKSDWIPISERLPDTDEYVLLSFENYTMAAIGRYEENDEGGTFYPGDGEKSYSSYGIFVNAWMPLPKPYREEQ